MTADDQRVRRDVPEALVAGGVLFVAAVVGLTRVVTASDLGSDKSLCGGKARKLVSDIPAWWPVNRRAALAVLGVLAAPAGSSDVSMRLVTVVLRLVNLVLVWALARSVLVKLSRLGGSSTVRAASAMTALST